MVRREPGLNLRQRDARSRANMRRQRQLLIGRELARSMSSGRLHATLAGQPPPDQRLVDIGDAHLEHRCRLPNRHPAIDRRKHPIPQILRITLTRPPTHRRLLVTAPYESHDQRKGNPLTRFRST